MGKKRYEVEAARSGLGSCISYLQSKINTFLLAPNSVTRKKRSQSPHVSASKQISARSSNRPVVRTCVRLSTHTHTIVPHALTKNLGSLRSISFLNVVVTIHYTTYFTSIHGIYIYIHSLNEVKANVPNTK